MPVYDYQCNHCKTIFEIHVSFREKEQGLHPVCPTCKSADTHQRMTTGLFIRKGSGDTATLFPSCGPNTREGCCG